MSDKRPGIDSWLPLTPPDPSKPMFGVLRDQPSRLTRSWPREPWYKRFAERLRDIWHTARWGRE